MGHQKQKEIQQKQSLKFGEEILNKYLKKINLTVDSPEFQESMPKLGYQNLDSMLLDLGRGELTTQAIARKLYPQEEQEECQEQSKTSDKGPDIKNCWFVIFPA